MSRGGLVSRRRVGEFALFLLIALALIAAREWLPYEGWGLVLRWCLTVLTTIALVWFLADLVITAVREFRRGLAGD